MQTHSALASFRSRLPDEITANVVGKLSTADKWLTEENAKLRTENERLADRLDLMERELGRSGMMFPADWKLTAHESNLLALVLKRPTMTKEQALVGMYSDRGVDWPEIKIIDVFMCKLRKKLRDAKSYIVIETVWGRGYRVEESSRKRAVADFVERFTTDRATTHKHND